MAESVNWMKKKKNTVALPSFTFKNIGKCGMKITDLVFNGKKSVLVCCRMGD